MPNSDDSYIKLCDFLKCRGAVGSGGQAKLVIQGGEVSVNGEVETRRGKKLRLGDRVVFDGTELAVAESDLSRTPPP